jgi:hypothetical protein
MKQIVETVRAAANAGRTASTWFFRITTKTKSYEASGAKWSMTLTGVTARWFVL